MEEFTGFSFCGIHSTRYGVSAVSNSGTYSMPLFASFSDTMESVDGYEGSYYFGTNYSNKSRPIYCVVENADENTYRAIQSWLNPKRVGKLTFDETPFKYYIAKIANVPSFDYIPMGDESRGYRYNALFTLEFIAFNPFAYSYHNILEDFENVDSNLYAKSGILPSIYTSTTSIESVNNERTLLLYNGGNVRTKPIITIEGTADLLMLKNLKTNQELTLRSFVDKTFTIDCQKGQVLEDGLLACSYHSGGYIELEGTNETYTYENIPFTYGSHEVIIDAVIDYDIVGKYLTFDGNFLKVANYDSITKTVSFTETYTGYNTSNTVMVVDLNEIVIAGLNLYISKIEFEYDYRYL